MLYFFPHQSKFYTISNKSISGCKSDDTWTLFSHRTAVVLWTCSMFPVDLSYQVVLHLKKDVAIFGDQCPAYV